MKARLRRLKIEAFDKKISTGKYELAEKLAGYALPFGYAVVKTSRLQLCPHVLAH
jgi:hypothetical protein